LVVKNGVKILSRISAGIPGLLSMDAIVFGIEEVLLTSARCRPECTAKSFAAP
jgi:hypothetical protein